MPDSIGQLFAPTKGVASPSTLHGVATTDTSCSVDEI
jgi:hypothetical protein